MALQSCLISETDGGPRYAIGCNMLTGAVQLTKQTIISNDKEGGFFHEI